MASDGKVFVLGRNVVALTETPIPLQENGTFTLDLRIEQDPLKVFPFQDMCVPAAVVWIKENFNLTPDQLIPFLLQLRGLWTLAIEETIPRNSVYKNANVGKPDKPGGSLSFGNTTDRWYGTRAFRVYVRITIGDEVYVHTLQPDNPEVVCKHIGGTQSNKGYKVVPGPPGRPFEAAYARGGAGTFEQQQEATIEESGGGPNYEFSAEWDEHCICTVHVEAAQQIRVAVHVEQDEISAPGGWGVNRGTVVEWRDVDVDGSLLCTIENPIGFTMGNNNGFSGSTDSELLAIPGLGAHAATRAMGWTWNGGGSIEDYDAFGLGQPRDTPWQLASTYSIDSVDYDWTETGFTNLRHYLHTLAYGYTEESAHEVFDPTVLQRYILGYVRSPALCGAALKHIDELGEYTGINPFASGFVRFRNEAPPAPSEDLMERIREATEAWYSQAKTRLALYETVVAPPKIKITATYSIVGEGMEIPETTQYFYANLPHTYRAQYQQFSFEDIYTYVEPDLYDQTKGVMEFEIPIVESDDRFSYGEIHAAVLNCEFNLDRDGFTAHWLGSIDDFDGDSTIPETGFYEDADTFIWFDGGTDYQDWLGIEDPPPPDWF